MAIRAPDRRRTAGRVREIAHVAARHGFGYAFERRPLRRAAATESLAVRGRHLREMLDELGPTFVKFGQLLSMRPDLVPEEIAAELRLLQDRVSPIPFDEVQAVVEEELGMPADRVFARFDPEPVAAASIGQVHLAELPSGRGVAVKVQRPTAARRIDADLALLNQLARVVGRRVERLRFIDTEAVVEEFARTMRRELDYRIEGRNADVFRHAFADDPRVAVPRVYWTFSSRRVLTLERLDGVKVGDLRLAETELEERRRLATVLTELWLEMIFRHGTFHADPHPANIFLLPDGRIGLIDFGMVGSLTATDVRRLTRLFLDLVNENADALPRRLRDLGVQFNRSQEDEFRTELRDVFARYRGESLGEIDPLAVMREAFDLIYRMQLRLPTRFVVLDKALATLGSLTAQLYPDLNVFEVAEPYAAELIAEQLSPRHLAARARAELEAYALLARELPYQVHDTLEQFRDGEVEVQFRHKGLDELISKADVTFNRLAIAVVVAGTYIGAGLLQIAPGPDVLGLNLLSLFGLLMATVLALVLAVSIIRSGRL
jgi:ubiquinone biosynthesis protein